MPSSRPKYQIYGTSNSSAVVMLKSEFVNDFKEKIDSVYLNQFLLLKVKCQTKI